MAGEAEYILGTDVEELDRLRFQHEAWLDHARRLWRSAGIGPGDRVLDLGAGPGFTTFDLARVVGPEGRVTAREVSARFLAHLASEARERGWTQVETSQGPVEELEAGPAPYDAAYARWLFCWLPDPGAALERVERVLRPGGVLLVQDYVHWAAMRVLPPSDLHRRVVEACMRSWQEGGGSIDVCALLPLLAPRAGLVLERLEPVARIGAPGSLEWRWLDGFYRSYLPRLVARGQLEGSLLRAFLEEWDARTAEGTGRVLAPLVADAVLRKPAAPAPRPG